MLHNTNTQNLLDSKDLFDEWSLPRIPNGGVDWLQYQYTQVPGERYQADRTNEHQTLEVDRHAVHSL